MTLDDTRDLFARVDRIRTRVRQLDREVEGLEALISGNPKEDVIKQRIENNYARLDAKLTSVESSF